VICKKVFKNNYLAIVLLGVTSVLQAATPGTVRFTSGDDKTELVGYLFSPQGAGPHPAVVMMHGRAGAYSSSRPGVMAAANLSARHRMWGEFWAARGYLALHVDSFGPRGHAGGFVKGSYSRRPAEVNEQTVRPLDAYGALQWLRAREDVLKERIALHGWSNGAMAALATMSPEFAKRSVAGGYRAVLAQYPGCSTQERRRDYVPYAPMLLLLAEDDDEVSPVVCNRMADAVRARGGDLESHTYPRAQHAYDDPGRTRQSHAPNAAALADTRVRAEAFFAKHLRP
jgi:carboxymethylenebutenolidase